MDYFAKWVEAKPCAQITKGKMWDFVWKFIIY